MTDSSAYIRAAAIYPQPVAFACGRIAHAWTMQDRLDAVLRAAETLTRYLAAIGFASLRARGGSAQPLPPGLQQFSGALSFGHFLTAVQQVSKIQQHPLHQDFANAFGAKAGKSLANDAIVALLTLRNDRGHDLLAISPALATTIFEDEKPDDRLEMALKACEPLLTYPLFLIANTEIGPKRRYLARRLLLMGDSGDPFPEQLEITEPLGYPNSLYIGTRGGVLRIAPFLLWDIVPARSTYGVYFIDKLDIIRPKLTYTTVSGDERTPTDPECSGGWQAFLAGEREPIEAVQLSLTETFLDDWVARRYKLEEAINQVTVKIPWHQFEGETLRWYGRLLGAADDDAALQLVICDKLLDGRDRIAPEEMQQLLLLFGQESHVRQTVRRCLIDCRAQPDPEQRWAERLESAANVLHCLRLTINFFGRHLSVDGLNIDGLRATTGSADYVATREGMVNLFIHQDYTDRSSAGQITIAPQRVTFFNAGASLVGVDALVDGARSQPRNPLISRALRLIGFAELAGSGLQQVQIAWRKAKRRPPIFHSDVVGNSFTLILDWRPVPDTADVFWKAKLGVSVSPEEAAVLALSAEADGVTVAQIASSQGLLIEDATKLAEGLVRKGLVQLRNGGIAIQDHLRSLAASTVDGAHQSSEG